MKGSAYRSNAVSAAAVALLSPDVLRVNLASTGPAALLGIELGAKNAFGGRALTDDAFDIMASIAYGSSLSDAGLVPDDGNEDLAGALPPGTMVQMTSDGIPSPSQAASPTFPYLLPMPTPAPAARLRR
jgi:hypothetical protein